MGIIHIPNVPSFRVNRGSYDWSALIIGARYTIVLPVPVPAFTSLSCSMSRAQPSDKPLQKQKSGQIPQLIHLGEHRTITPISNKTVPCQILANSCSVACVLRTQFRHKETIRWEIRQNHVQNENRTQKIGLTKKTAYIFSTRALISSLLIVWYAQNAGMNQLQRKDL